MNHGSHRILIGDCLDSLWTLDAGSVRCCVTSPPYWDLRDYGVDGQIGLEPTPDEWVVKLVAVFREVRRVLADDGTLWLNCGDAYTSGGRDSYGTFSTYSKQETHANIKQTPRAKQPDGLKPKDLIGLPWMLAFALRSDGWYLRSDIIWAKPNPMPESVRDRPTKSHEYLFLLSKSERYYWDQEAVKEPSEYPDDNRKLRQIPEDYEERAVNDRIATMNPNGAAVYPTRNIRSVWSIPTQAYPKSHFATFPEALVEPCIKAGSAEGDTVLDPFSGSGTVGAVACPLGRNYIGCELNPEYAAMSERRIAKALRPATARTDLNGDAPLFEARQHRKGVQR